MPSPHLRTVCLLLFSVFPALSSCDKPKKLDAERVKLTAERQAVLDEIALVDSKSAALGKAGLSGDAGEMNRKAATLLEKATEHEKVATDKLDKWVEIEVQFNALREKASAYKAKNLR